MIIADPQRDRDAEAFERARDIVDRYEGATVTDGDAGEVSREITGAVDALALAHEHRGYMQTRDHRLATPGVLARGKALADALFEQHVKYGAAQRETRRRPHVEEARQLIAKASASGVLDGDAERDLVRAVEIAREIFDRGLEREARDTARRLLDRRRELLGV